MRRARGIFVVAIAVALHAGEEKPPASITGTTRPAAAADAGTALDAAKRDLDLIKASREPGPPAADALPKFATPEWQHGSGATPVPKSVGQKSPNASAAQKKSTHWLVDAMEKGSSDARTGDKTREARRRDATRGEGTAIGAPPGESDSADREDLELAGEKEARRAEEDREGRDASSAARKPEAAAPNPLAGYLAGWMTPADYALLKPVIESADADASERGTGSIANPSSGPAAFSFSTTTPASRASSPLMAPTENPFIEAMNAVSSAIPAGATGANTVAASPQNSAPLPSVFTPPLEPLPVPPTPAGKSSVPDFVKPQNDEKYFKPLRRF